MESKPKHRVIKQGNAFIFFTRSTCQEIVIEVPNILQGLLSTYFITSPFTRLCL